MNNLELRTPQEILLPCTQRRSLSPHARGKLSMLSGDVTGIVDALQRLAGRALSAEFVFEDDRGDDLYTEWPHLADAYLQVARGGQGDAWLLCLRDGQVHFFDHDKDAGETLPLGLDFWGLLQLADLMGCWERHLDMCGDTPDTRDLQRLYSAMRALHPALPAHYPFRLEP